MNDDSKRDVSDYTISIDMVDNAVLTCKGDFEKIKCNEVTIALGKRLFEDIPVETIQNYRAIRTEEIYWKNKLDDLNDVCKILSAYDIDTDYIEIILRTREAAREAKRLGDEARSIEKKYPTIQQHLIQHSVMHIFLMILFGIEDGEVNKTNSIILLNTSVEQMQLHIQVHAI